MKREPLTLDNETGREIPSLGAGPKLQPSRRAANRERNFIEDELRGLAEDVAVEFVDSVAKGIADALRVDSVLMRRR